MTMGEGKVSSGYESEGEESSSSGGSLSVTGHTESPQPPAIVSSTTATTPVNHSGNISNHHASSLRPPEINDWFHCQPPPVGPQHSPPSAPLPPHHLGHHFNPIMHHQATAY